MLGLAGQHVRAGRRRMTDTQNEKAPVALARAGAGSLSSPHPRRNEHEHFNSTDTETQCQSDDSLAAGAIDHAGTGGRHRQGLGGAILSHADTSGGPDGGRARISDQGPAMSARDLFDGLAASSAPNAIRAPVMKTNRRVTSYFVTETEGDERAIGIPQNTRPDQTLKALIDAKGCGITALEMSNWALRLGDYVWLLRHRYRLDISTEYEAHDLGNGIKGEHARYRLTSRVRPVIESSDERRAVA